MKGYWLRAVKKFNPAGLIGRSSVVGILLIALLLSLMGCRDQTSAAAHDHRGNGAGHDNDAEIQTGSHGGKVFEAGELRLELAIVERGVPPQYHAWVWHQQAAVNTAELKVTLTRLGGVVETVNFTREGDHYVGDREIIEPHSFDVAIDLAAEGARAHWTFASYEGRVTIDAAQAKASGITTAPLGAMPIERTRRVYGELVPSLLGEAQVGARFAGVIKAILVQPGARVAEGDPLIEIESNESLRRYRVTAPMAGVVANISARVGAITDTRPLLQIIDPSQWLAALQIFPADRVGMPQDAKVYLSREGQSSVGRIARWRLDGNDERAIARVLPAGVQIAEVPLPDAADRPWILGEKIAADVVMDAELASLAVDNRALQTFRDWTVVFVQVGDTYEVRPVQLGLVGATHSQVLAGLSLGDTYVVENSYLIKADIEKAGAEHDH